MEDDIKSNGWCAKNVIDAENSLDLLNIFQKFYQITGRLPLSNDLLFVPDGETPPREDRVNMKSLYDMFRHTDSHKLVSLPFLRALQYYLDINDFTQIKNALTEFYQNLSYFTLSAEFTAVSHLAARISYLIKATTHVNIDKMEKTGR